MLDRIRAWRRRRAYRRTLAQRRVPLHDLQPMIARLAGSDAIAICPTPTGRCWQGVLSATEGLFGHAVFQLPQVYSTALYTPDELARIAAMLADTGLRQVVLSGYLDYFDHLVRPLRARGVAVSVIYHGSHVTVHEDPTTARHFETFIAFARSGAITKIGLVKKGLDKTLRQLTGLNAFPIHLKTPADVLDLACTRQDGRHIGALTHGDFRKNIYNQVSAALMVPGATVHMKEPYHTSYLGNAERLRFHPHVGDRRDFLRLLGSMTANLYVTYSECWGQLVTESLAVGVPCLAADVSAVLDFDPEMKRRLVVAEHDNDHAIFERLMDVVDDAAWFRTTGPEYVQRVNRAAEHALAEFLRAS